MVHRRVGNGLKMKFVLTPALNLIFSPGRRESDRLLLVFQLTIR
jgi:hypothetical protein